MATYIYRAIDKHGKERKGSLESDSRDLAAMQLKKSGLLISKLEEAGAFGKDLDIAFLQQKPKARDMAVFCRQFVSIINAGVSAVSALDMLSQQTENKILRTAILDCKRSIEKGESMASAMRPHEAVFSSIFITMVAAGEASGSLDVSFTRMAEQFEKSAKLKATIKKATMYPIVLSVVAVLVLIVLLAFVVPTFEDMFAEMGADLPALTQMVIGVSRFVQTRWYILLAVAVLLILGMRQYVNSPPGKTMFSKLALRIPIVKNLTVKSASARMARTMSTLLGSGLPLIDALDITAGIMTNVYFKDALISSKDDVAMGTALSEPLTRCGLFPPMVCHMQKIGEETGNVEGMLGNLADYYEEEVETATQQLTTILEPLIIVIMALIIGTIVLSVILAMSGMYAALDAM
ncbi:MAG: type II secretion system F family protein [Evtepia sp.]